MNTLSISPDRLEHLRHLEVYLQEQIRGQDHVIPRVVSALHRGELGLTAFGRPRGSFLLLGPTGVGKTELSIAFTRYLLGDDKLFRFDMSEYQTQESLGVLLGARVGEVGLLGLARAKSARARSLPANARRRARDKWEIVQAAQDGIGRHAPLATIMITAITHRSYLHRNASKSSISREMVSRKRGRLGSVCNGVT